ncbi:acyl-CoA dehydrogenase family protein [Nocardioides yefusunii]|uniref:Acyl-CoA dehydrogenase family protein n=1 Tax=Nocardioides yefusunii TaxID=2500546 RepID=A0ABW1QWC4_9ACTN|nr:acyl-CoA dehydrogenase family protein [Nocardioides yefusunii]
MTHPWPQADPTVLTPVEEHDELRTVVRQVLTKYADRETVRAAADTAAGHDVALWKRLNEELEIGGLALSEQWGGSGFGLPELAVLLEEVGAALLPDPVLSSAVLGVRALTLADEVDRDLLAATVAGSVVVTVADLDTPCVPVATLSGDGAVRVTGRVERVVHGALAQHLVTAVDVEGEHVIALVDLAAAGVTVVPRTVVDLTRRQADVELEGVEARVLVGSGRAGSVARRLGLLRKVAVASEQSGAVSHLLDLVVEYVTQREQFSRPIGSFQAVKHRLADVLVDRERALSASRYAAAVLEQAMEDDEVPDDVELAVEVAAVVCQDAFVRTAHEAVQLHGGIGFTWEHRAHYYVRRALGDEGLGGGSARGRARVAALVEV